MSSPPGAAIVSGSRRWPQRRFVTFKEFKEFVQPLQFHRSSDYKAWSRTAARPSFIPARPDDFYRSVGWISWMDGLSYRTERYRQTKSTWFPSRNACDDQRIHEYGNKRAMASETSIAYFLQTMKRLTIDRDYEFRRLPRSARGTFLVRTKRTRTTTITPDGGHAVACLSPEPIPIGASTLIPGPPPGFDAKCCSSEKTSLDPDVVDDVSEPRWKMLHVASATRRNTCSKAFLFKKMRFVREGGIVLVCEPLELLEVAHLEDVDLRCYGKCDWFTRKDIASATAPCGGTKPRTRSRTDAIAAELFDGSVERDLVRVRLVTELDSVLQRLPAKTEQEWLDELDISRNFRVFGQCFSQMSEAMVAAGLPRLEAVHECGSFHNAVFGGRKVLFRAAALPRADTEKQVGGLKVHVERQKAIEGRRMRTPIDIADGISALIATVYEPAVAERSANAPGKPILRGFFFFPADILRSWGLLSAEQFGIGGRSTLALYPLNFPGVAPASYKIKERG